MSTQYLVTYASRANSTAGVAEAIGKSLGKRGLRVDVMEMSAVKDLTPYSAVIAGSAIHGKQWLPEALQFVRTNQSALRGKPFAAFLVCMTLAMPSGEKYREHVSGFLQPVRQMVPTVSEGLFAGALNIQKIPSLADRLKFRISVLLGVWKEGDHRDWEAIDHWAEELLQYIR
jgi:menaquinone-dependent protoporphyrinogen oxidase